MKKNESQRRRTNHFTGWWWKAINHATKIIFLSLSSSQLTQTYTFTRTRRHTLLSSLFLLIPYSFRKIGPLRLSILDVGFITRRVRESTFCRILLIRTFISRSMRRRKALRVSVSNPEIVRLIRLFAWSLQVYSLSYQHSLYSLYNPLA